MEKIRTSMGPPLPLQSRNQLSETLETVTVHENPKNDEAITDLPLDHDQSTIPYTIPSWSEPPCHPFRLEVLKDGVIMDQIDVSRKGAYVFGRLHLCDFVLHHPTVSRFHAGKSYYLFICSIISIYPSICASFPFLSCFLLFLVLQFKSSGQAYLYDLGSTHGTYLNKVQVMKNVYLELHVGDVIRFGSSSRLYIFQGPPELMLPETDIKMTRKAKLHQEIQDREASLQRARREASLSNGISWGMGEDAIEENEDDVDEVTWQTYKGQLTEKQEKTREKVIKRTEKIAHMKKEIDAIRAKDIAQGGLTQGQQTQIARNEQRIAQIAEELESLEETLNESIQESLGARLGKISLGKKKGGVEDEDEYASDDDEFYDRTKKKPSIKKSVDTQSIETSNTLLDKKDVITKQMEDKRSLILVEKNKIISETNAETAAGDTLDSYMVGLSSQLVLDKAAQLEKELHALQPELDRIVYLLKIADPSGEAAKKRELQIQNLKPENSKNTIPEILNRPPVQQKKLNMSGKSGKGCPTEVTNVDSSKTEADKSGTEVKESKTSLYTAVKPQWLGAVEEKKVKEPIHQEAILDMIETDQFVDYKDRKAVLSNADDSQVKIDLGLENAAPGLIIRKQKQGSDDKSAEQSTSLAGGAQIKVEDAVALLLKHKRGYHASEEETFGEKNHGENQPKTDNKKPKRVLGPERPSFLEEKSDYESWVPPKGQSGDGRTSLNDRYGY